MSDALRKFNDYLSETVSRHTLAIGWVLVSIILLVVYLMWYDWHCDGKYSKALKAAHATTATKSGMATYMGAATAVNFSTMDLRGSGASAIGSCGRKGIIEDIATRSSMLDDGDQKETPAVKAGFLSRMQMKNTMGNRKSKMSGGPLSEADLARNGLYGGVEH